MPQDSESRALDKVIVRLPDGMRDQLKTAAADNNRSMNAEIVSRLGRYDSLGGEVDAMWEVGRALASAIDEVCGPDDPTPLLEKVGDVFSRVSERGEVDRTQIFREFSSDAERRLRSLIDTGLPALPEGLTKRLNASAEASGRSVEDELAFRLENSFEVSQGFSDLAELAIESLQDAADDAKREVEEYRVMIGTVKLLRYMVDHLAPLVPNDKIPDDITVLLSMFSSGAGTTADDLPQVMRALHESMEARDRIADQQDGDNAFGRTSLERKQRLEAIVDRLEAKAVSEE